MSSITNAGITHKIDGVTYEFGPLDLEDIEWLEMWLKARVIEAGNAAAQTLPTAQGDRVLRMAASEAASIDIMSGDFVKLLSVSGVARMVWRMVVKKHPDVAIATVQQWVVREDVTKPLLAKMNLARPGQVGKEDAANSGAPLREPRRAKEKKSSTGRRSRGS